MATMKSLADLDIISHTLYCIERRHRDIELHTTCQAALCVKCGLVRFSCAGNWKTDCCCDSQFFTPHHRTTIRKDITQHGR